MSVDKLRFGILGCGVIGPHHARAISGLEGAELVAVADVVPELAKELAGEYGCSYYASLEQMLSGVELDAVCVCTPSGMHAEGALAAIEAGKDVVIEKPVDVTLKAVNSLIEVQRATGRKIAVVSQHRFDAATQLDGGGVLINQAIHSIDLLQWLMGPVLEVAAYTGLLAHERIEVEDTAVAILKFANGTLGIIVATTAAYPGLTARIAVHGDRGSAVIDDDELTYFHVAGEGQKGDAYGAGGDENQAEQLMARYGEAGPGSGAGADPDSLSLAHRDQIKDFVEAVRVGREPLVNLEEGRKPLAIIQGIYESARSGGPVRIEG
jgi:predicted dehydrogenase